MAHTGKIRGMKESDRCVTFRKICHLDGLEGFIIHIEGQSRSSDVILRSQFRFFEMVSPLFIYSNYGRCSCRQPPTDNRSSSLVPNSADRGALTPEGATCPGMKFVGDLTSGAICCLPNK